MMGADIIDASNTFRRCLTELLDTRTPSPAMLSAETTAFAQMTALRLIAEIDELQALLRLPRGDGVGRG